ncbi:MAG: GNAT family N-acetyltransferase [Ignavibacteria bacterium]|jgi:lipid II:glycine glycyltransferase (peptidoglycan interpeptide bridge formation enzyme)
MIEFIPFADSGLSNDEWDEFVDNANGGTIFHKRKFLNYHPEGRFVDKSIVVKKKNKLHSLLPAVEINREGKKILSSHSGASYGGFVTKKDLNVKDSFTLVKSLEEYAKGNNFDAVQLTFPPIIYQDKYNNYIEFALFRNGYKYIKREISSVVQLDVEKEKILSTFKAESRTAVKKSIAQGVEIAETERFKEYYEILKKNLKLRHNVNPTHTLDELLLLKKIFPAKVRLFGAFLDDKLIAGVCNFSANKEVVLAFYISHDEDYQKYRPVNLLFFEIMKRYHEEGYRFLDFGIFTVNMDPNWGLGKFKESFGARGIFRDTFYKEF